MEGIRRRPGGGSKMCQYWNLNKNKKMYNETGKKYNILLIKTVFKANLEMTINNTVRLQQPVTNVGFVLIA